MASIPSWAEQPAVWDTCVLGGLPLPGSCRVDVKRSRDVAKKKASGSDGAETTDRGAKVAEVTITWQVWDDPDEPIPLDEVAGIVELLSPRPGAPRRPAPVDIAHPNAALLNVRSIMIEDIDVKDVQDCVWTATIKASEWLPPKPKGTSTPKKSNLFDNNLTPDQNRAVDLGIPLDSRFGRDGLAASILRSDIAREEAKTRPPAATPPTEQNGIVGNPNNAIGGGVSPRPVVTLP